MQSKMNNTYPTFCKKSDFYQCVFQLPKASLRIEKKGILYISQMKLKRCVCKNYMNTKQVCVSIRNYRKLKLHYKTHISKLHVTTFS